MYVKKHTIGMAEVETTIHQSLLNSSDECREMAEAHSSSDKHDSPSFSVSNDETRFDRSREIIPAVLVTKVRGNVEILHQVSGKVLEPFSIIELLN